jgi:CDP-6-deoxy-D-xylo-4-hexulose-3-dehydrase
MWNLADDTITNDEIDALAGWLGGYPRLTQGPLVREFEERWSDWLGTEESVMVSSGTTANMLMMMAVERRLGR